MVISTQSREIGLLLLKAYLVCDIFMNVLFVLDIDQNLSSVPQLIEKGFKNIFADNVCLIKGVKGRDVFKIKTRAKCYALNQPIKEVMP